jgi:hypothetical protein
MTTFSTVLPNSRSFTSSHTNLRKRSYANQEWFYNYLFSTLCYLSVHTVSLSNPRIKHYPRICMKELRKNDCRPQFERCCNNYSTIKWEREYMSFRIFLRQIMVIDILKHS